MRHVFILNPAAGKNQNALQLRGLIDAYFERHPEADYKIFVTEGRGAATRFVQEQCAEGVPVRFYACGGDGTLQETANGIPAGADAELTVIPCGSGNDYVRIFGGREAFRDLPDLIEGVAIPVDAVNCDGRLSLNIASIGMDAKVCAKMTAYKRVPGVNGSLAYDLAIVNTFFTPIGNTMHITIEGENGPVERHGKYLMALAANGQYYGGGYCGAPQAVADDGMLDLVLVKLISRFTVLGFLKKYKAGHGEELACYEHIRGTAMTVTTEKPTYCNIDGECSCGTAMHFSILPGAFRFVIPASVARARGIKPAAVCK